MDEPFAAGKSVIRNERGFTLVELTIAMLVLIVGIVAVGQLVPAALQNNMHSRNDITAAVVAQREINQMVNQSLFANSFVDSDGRTINLGAPGAPSTVTLDGGPVTMNGTYAQISFSNPAVAGYSFNYTDPNKSGGPSYEVRWAVVVTTNPGGVVSSKRFIVGCWKRDPRQITRPVNIDTSVSKF